MTVCTYELALRDLGEDRALAVTLHEIADVGQLRQLPHCFITFRIGSVADGVNMLPKAALS
jgi:hypothetical protein